MRKYIFSFKEDELHMALISKTLSKIKIVKDLKISEEQISRILENNFKGQDNIFSQQIKAFLSHSDTKSKKVEIIIAFNNVITRSIEVSYLNKKNLKAYIENNINQFFTVNMDEYFYDYKIIGISKPSKLEKRKMTVMLVVIPRSMVLSIKELVEANGLQIAKISVYPDIMMNIAYQYQSMAVIDIGSHKSIVTIYDQGQTFLYTTLNTQLLNHDVDEIDDMIEEIEHLTDFYASRHQGEKLDALCLIGSYAKDEYINNQVQTKLNMPIQSIVYKKWKYLADQLTIENHPNIVMSQVKSKAIYNKKIDFSQEVQLNKGDAKEFKAIYIFFILLLLTGLYNGQKWYFMEGEKLKNTEALSQSNEYILIQEEIDLIINEKSLLTEKNNAIIEIESEEYDYNEIFDQIQKALPQHVTVSHIFIDHQQVDLSLNIMESTLDAIEVIISINALDYFERIDIEELALDDTTKALTLNLRLKN